MPQGHRFEIGAELGGLSLASALKRRLPDMSWSQVKRLIARRQVCVNRTPCLDEGRRLKPGDRIEVFEDSKTGAPPERNVRIVYQDEHLVVVDKPAGILTVRRLEERHWPAQRKAKQPTLEEAVEDLLQGVAPQRSAVRPRPLSLHAVHRLDRDTSGLMLFALSNEAREKLVRMFARHEVQRTYLAVVQGRPKAQTIETWLVRDRGDGLRGSSADGPKAPQARQAVTHLRPVQEIGKLTLVECRLETGRTHQIRIHLSEIGHPVCGEKTYTHRLGQSPLSDATSAPRHALHSAELRFTHPVTGQPMHFSSPLPQDLSMWLEGWKHRPSARGL